METVRLRLWNIRKMISEETLTVPHGNVSNPWEWMESRWVNNMD